MVLLLLSFYFGGLEFDDWNITRQDRVFHFLAGYNFNQLYYMSWGRKETDAFDRIARGLALTFFVAYLKEDIDTNGDGVDFLMTFTGAVFNVIIYEAFNLYKDTHKKYEAPLRSNLAEKNRNK